ncbi:MAG: hypothetical protein A2Z99_17905 [Treponema sp. GWB1_62_6]|nr:MAG: hypothetical protein A2Y36_14695 [Treponema sp. GWA1_62_8]OHE64110.1 MAG: hypothetical protein A2001_06435 [Treponema sp. GWC1_61_84]OHE67166.1 MAG: hypothetical protein A2Z99_17905 [Treponema sp. GWB1_62_6]OHE68349.1 MAG: hypothetical protein A2413_09520 [Treponema sp. RIFOXYC1_FULL_61_9]
MKRFSAIAALLATAAFAFASEELDVYTWIYRASISPAERFAVLKNVAEAEIPGAGELYAEALSQLLIEFPNLKTVSERESADSTARLLADLLGEAKYAAAATDLWRIVQTFSNPLVKADALIAIGRTRSEDLFEQVARTLQDLNLRPTSDPESGERIAYGALLALEKYRKIEGFPPVFFASTGWYSRRVRDQAAATLPLIADDPTQALEGIMRQGDSNVKLLALQTEDASKAGAAAKSAFAALALSEGWTSATSDVKERQILANLRKLSMAVMQRSGVTSSAIPLLDRSYREGIDMEEKLSAISALAAGRSDDAALVLASALMKLNERRRADATTQDDERIVRAVIPALGATGSVKGRPALQAVENMDWTNAVKVLAGEALKKLK